MGCYGNKNMLTPNLDHLASQSVLFNDHFVQVPTCGASRYALLTGLRPNPAYPLTYTNNAFSLMPKTYDGGPPVSMPQQFKLNGYYTVSLGKISHSPDGRHHGGSMSKEGGDGKPEVPFSWDEVYTPYGEWGSAWDVFFAYAGGKSRVIGKTPAYENADVPDTGYPDGLIAQEAIKQLRKLKAKNQPFFLATGFYKPHLPFNSPKKYWDEYDEKDIHLAPYRRPPKNIDPKISLHNSGELTPRYAGVELAGPDKPYKVTPNEERKLRHAYFAAVSYVDAQIGKVLKELKDLGLDKNTIVVVWGDHGWHLGDLGIWGKHTPYEIALRSPLIVRVPGLHSSGKTANGIVETIDIYPTLCDLCNIPIPENQDGKSFVPLLKNPEKTGKEEAYSYWRMHGLWAKSIRTKRYRLIRWTNDDGEIKQLELYDQQNDTNETVNIAKQHPDIVKKLLQNIDTDWAETVVVNGKK